MHNNYAAITVHRLCWDNHLWLVSVGFLLNLYVSQSTILLFPNLHYAKLY
jgi:hypothetical protein